MKLNEFVNMQVAVVVTGISICHAYMMEHDVKPLFSAGHSIGEYTALMAAGALALPDAVKILKTRGELIKKILSKDSARMTIVEEASRDVIEEVIKDNKEEFPAYIACFNSEYQYALCGCNESMDVIEELLYQKKAKVTPLFFSPPMHSPLMEEIANSMEQHLSKFQYNSFEYPIITNIDGIPFSDEHRIPKLMSQHLVKPVQWGKTLDFLESSRVDKVIELSPKRMISDFYNCRNSNLEIECYSGPKDL